MDLIQTTTLGCYIKHFNCHPLPEVDTRCILRQLLIGVKNLQVKGLIHRDIKPNNVLFSASEERQLQIIDFGLAVQLSDYPFLLMKCGSPGFVAPEIFTEALSGEHYAKCDMFSIGAIFYMLLTGRSAFQGSSRSDVLRKNQECKINLELRRITFEAKDLLSQLLQKDPSDRPNAEKALQHCYFFVELERPLTNLMESHYFHEFIVNSQELEHSGEVNIPTFTLTSHDSFKSSNPADQQAITDL